MKKFIPVVLATSVVPLTSLQAAQPETATQLDTVVSIGTHRPDVTALESTSPIDVISASKLQSVGAANLNQALQRLLPSLNWPQGQGLVAMSNVQSASLRGLYPDQTLILVNGKRRHASARVKQDNDWGRATQPVDLNTIPLSAIDHVEVLRDSASALYGSDAIAGVINIVLKEKDSGGSLSAQLGEYSKGDGLSRVSNGWYGLALPNDGFLTLSFSTQDSERTNTAVPDTRRFYDVGDPREATANRNIRRGTPGTEGYNLLANAESSIADWTVYGFANYSDRDTDGGGYFILPGADGNVRSIYPDGFQAQFESRSQDVSVAAGTRRGDLQQGILDISLSYGKNTSYSWVDSLNASYGSASPTHFNTGRRENAQANAAIDYRRELPISWLDNPLSVATGISYRREQYQTFAGDSASWSNGGMPILDGPNAGNAAPVGSQASVGLSPEDEGRYKRHVSGLYINLENNLTERWLASLAGRLENYSDFGDTANAAFSNRFQLTPTLAVRGSLSTGYRAPSLGQLGTSVTNYSAIGANIFQTKILPTDHVAAGLLGAEKLKPEESQDISLGLVWRPSPVASLTVDLYQIEINDRVALTGNLTGSQVRQILTNAGYPQVTAAAFFTNALDTRTRGLDVMGRYHLDLARHGNLDLGLGFNLNRTKITNIKDAPAQLAGSGLSLISRDVQGHIEKALPNNKLLLSADWQYRKFSLNSTLIRYGTYSYIHATLPERDQKFPVQWVANLSASYQFDSRFSVTLGADNLFNSHPGEFIPVNRTASVDRYSFITPAGGEGRFHYARLDYRF